MGNTPDDREKHKKKKRETGGLGLQKKGGGVIEIPGLGLDDSN